MEPYVDWFGFMGKGDSSKHLIKSEYANFGSGYDLHGPWDAQVDTIGAVVNPQSSALDIENDLLPLWFDNLDPAKVERNL
jgi:chitinase